MATNDTLYIYTRVSTESQMNRNSLSEQIEAGIKKAKELEMKYLVYDERGKIYLIADKFSTIFEFLCISEQLEKMGWNEIITDY